MTPHGTPALVPASRAGRLLYAYVTLLLPLACFALSWDEKPMWQSGRLGDYAWLMFNARVAGYFYPLLLFSMAGMAALLFKPASARHWPVRLAVYSGVVLALQYGVLLVQMAGGTPLQYFVPLFCVVGLALPAGLGWLYRKSLERRGPAFTRRWVLALAMLWLAWGPLLWVLLGKYREWEAVFAPLSVLLAGSLACAPVWCLALFGLVSLRLWRVHWETPRLPVLGSGVAWLLAWLAAWRQAYLGALALYATLPTEPPRCFIATAAAQGHPWLVRSWPARAADGLAFRANAQLRYLKCLELALLGLSPRWHGRLRRVYDVWGLALARRIRHPLGADLAYLLLLPIEWAARLLLHALSPGHEKLAERLYPAQDKRKKEIPPCRSFGPSAWL